MREFGAAGMIVDPYVRVFAAVGNEPAGLEGSPVPSDSCTCR